MNVEKEPYSRLDKEISDFDPDMIGLSLRNVDSMIKNDLVYYFKEVKPTAELIKRVKPKVKLIIGGPGFSIFALQIMKRIREFDIGVFLEAEETMPELLENIENPEKVTGLYYRKNGNVYFTGKRKFPDFDSLPMPDRSIIDLKPYLGPYNNIGIQTRRGCSLQCLYCNYPFLGGSVFRVRSPKKVVDEIEDLVNNYNINNFMFADTVFNRPKKNAQEICQEIINRKLDVEWNAYFDLMDLDEPFIKLAHKAGCKQFIFSPDAITESGLKHLKKHFSIDDFNRVFQIVNNMKGIRLDFSFFCNFPGQTLMGYLKTIYFYIKGNILLIGRGKININWIRIEPHTEVYKLALDEGVIKRDTDLLPDDEAGFESLFYNTPLLKIFDKFVILMLVLSDKLFKPFLKSLFVPKLSDFWLDLH